MPYVASGTRVQTNDSNEKEKELFNKDTMDKMMPLLKKVKVIRGRDTKNSQSSRKSHWSGNTQGFILKMKTKKKLPKIQRSRLQQQQQSILQQKPKIQQQKQQQQKMEK